MVQATLKRAVWMALAASALMLHSQVGRAAQINIVVSNMDLTYLGSVAGGSIFDAMGGHAGGNLLASQSDEVSGLFQKDSTILASMTNAANDLYADFRLDGVGATLPLNDSQESIGNNNNLFGIDLFQAPNANPGSPLLRLTTDELDVLFLSPGAFLFSGIANLSQQNLPAGLVFDTSQPIYFSYAASLPAVNGTSPVGVAAAVGALTISGTLLIPEPATVGLVLMGAAVLVAGRFRRFRP